MTVGFAVSGVVLALGPLRGRRDLPAPSWEAVPQLQH
jgi:hypothetical protein